MEATINWVKAHGFPYKVVNGCLYWQTAIQTAKMNAKGHITWHNWNFFNKVSKDP